MAEEREWLPYWEACGWGKPLVFDSLSVAGVLFQEWPAGCKQVRYYPEAPEGTIVSCHSTVASPWPSLSVREAVAMAGRLWKISANPAYERPELRRILALDDATMLAELAVARLAEAGVSTRGRRNLLP